MLLPDANEQEQSELAATLLPACRLMESSVAYASPVEIGGAEQKVLTAAGVAAFTACRDGS